MPEGVREALAVFLGEPSTEADNATPAISKRGSGMSGGGRKWADPGYQADHKQRYDITTKSKALTAWRYIHQASKAAKYSSSQLKNIRARIRSALKGFGVTVSNESAPGSGIRGALPSHRGRGRVLRGPGALRVLVRERKQRPGEPEPVVLLHGPGRPPGDPPRRR